MEGVSILDLGQSADHEQIGILRAEKLDLPDPVLKVLAIPIRRLLVLVVWWHLVRLHVDDRLLPQSAGCGVSGTFQRSLKVDPAFASPVPANTDFRITIGIRHQRHRFLLS